VRGTCGALAVLLLSLGACRGTPTWGAKATPLPAWRQVGRAALAAASDPQTWAPLAGAALLQVRDFDEDVSDWAREHTPLFGSADTASEWSGIARDATRAGWAVTVLGTPSGCRTDTALWGKAKGVAFEALGVWAQGEIVIRTKDATSRLRPDGADRDSMPSGHASESAAFSALGRRNLESMPLPRGTGGALGAGFTAMTALSSWGRVEAGKHYPSDVLVGWGVGNFVALFVHDAFIGRARDGPCLYCAPGERGLEVGFSLTTP